MTFRLTINCDNAAFDGDLNGEVARIIRHLAADVRAGSEIVMRDLCGRGFKLRDINGNTVGTAEMVED